MYQKIIAGTTTLVAPTDPSISNQPIFIECNSTAGAITINLPALSTLTNILPCRYIIVDAAAQANTNNITIAPNGSDVFNNASGNVVIRRNRGAVIIEASSEASTPAWIVSRPNDDNTVIARTATADGLTTGTISDNGSNLFIQVTSDDANKIIVLPPPVPGTRVKLLNGATGYEIRSSSPTTVAINGGTGAAAESAVAANIYVELVCVSTTAWIGSTFTTAGVKGVLEVAAP